MKRIIALILAITMAFSLAACDTKGEKEPSSEASSVEPAPSIPDDVTMGEPLDAPWLPESFLVEDWENSEDMFSKMGEFVTPSGMDTRTVWTNKSYNLSSGFVFYGSLYMKNGYNNFYGEWCSAYFGTDGKCLELRISNDQKVNGPKDNTYTAYLIYNGTELATCDLSTDPNAAYKLNYDEGSVTVQFNERTLNWTLPDGKVATSVAVNDTEYLLANAKLGLKLSNNYCPNGRKWSNIVLAPAGYILDDSKNLDFYVYGGEASVIGGSYLVGEIVIPSTYEGHPVTAIKDNAFKSCGDITSVVIPEGVESIGNNAFDHCDSLANITLPSSLKSIGQYAFNHCDSLTKVTLPQGLKFLDMWAFSFCGALTEIIIPDSVKTIGVAAFYDCTALEKVFYGGAEDDVRFIAIKGENHLLTNAAWEYNYAMDDGKDDVTDKDDGDKDDSDKENNKDVITDTDDKQAAFPIIPICVGAVLLIGIATLFIIKKKRA